MPVPTAFDLSGRVAVVTGAGRPEGIGFAAAGLLAELGAAVMISATTDRIRDRASELTSAGFDAAGVAADLTNTAAAPGLVSAALERWGRLDIVVNNAGMISAAVPVFESGTVESMDLVTWQAALAWNVVSTAPRIRNCAVAGRRARGGAGGRDSPLRRPAVCHVMSSDSLGAVPSWALLGIRLALENSCSG